MNESQNRPPLTMRCQNCGEMVIGDKTSHNLKECDPKKAAAHKNNKPY